MVARFVAPQKRGGKVTPQWLRHMCGDQGKQSAGLLAHGQDRAAALKLGFEVTHEAQPKPHTLLLLGSFATRVGH